MASALNFPGLEADLYSTLATVYSDRGDYVKAEDVLRRALTLQKQVFGEEKVVVAECLHSLSWMLSDLTAVLKRQGKLLEAEKIYQEALLKHTELLSKPSQQAQELRRRGEFFARFGRWPEAVTDVRRALALNPDDDETSHFLTPLLIQSGDLEPAAQRSCR